MKKSFHLIATQRINAAGKKQIQSVGNATRFFHVVMVLVTCLFMGCKKQGTNETASELHSLSRANTDQEVVNYYRELDAHTLWELQQVRAATAKFQNIQNAFKNNYVDINLVMPNMGHHILKAELVSPVFDLKRPPILVYNKRADDSFELVAVEYAVPIDPQSPHTPPEGFTGSADVWDFNTLNTGWWTLHAWVWKNNPDGAFNPTNPTVQVR